MSPSPRWGQWARRQRTNRETRGITLSLSRLSFFSAILPAVNLLLKIALSATIVVAATALAKRVPSLAGLVGVMPLTGALVLALVYLENSGNPQVMESFAKGALWGLLPVVVFYAAALVCLKREFPLGAVLGVSFAAWAGAALVHQQLLK